MTTLHYYYEDAIEAANEFAMDNDGYIARNEITVSDSSIDDWADNKAMNLCWSGETSAIVVRDNETHEDVAYFAYWTSKQLED